MSTISIHHADNLAFLKAYRGKPIDLIYIDPPFNTGKVQHRQRMRSIADDDGDRTGFAGKRYRTEAIESRYLYVDRTYEITLEFSSRRLEKGTIVRTSVDQAGREWEPPAVLDLTP